MGCETIIVERPEPRIARIVMNRPEARNAQNLQMTYESDATGRAIDDPDISIRMSEIEVDIDTMALGL